MPQQGDGSQSGIRPPPIWRYDAFSDSETPLTSPAQVSTTPLVGGQHGEIHGSAGGSFTFQGTVATGDRIVVGIFCHNVAPTAPTAPGLTFYRNGLVQTDGGGNTYTVWSAVPSAPFSSAITINGTSGNFFSAQFAEIQGLSQDTGSETAGVDVTAGATGNGTALTSGPTGLPTQFQVGYLYSFFGVDANELSITSGGQVTQKERTDTAVNPSVYATGWGDNPDIGPDQNPAGAWTVTNSARWGTIIVVYKVAGATIAPGAFTARSGPVPAHRFRPDYRYDGPLVAGVPGTTIPIADAETATITEGASVLITSSPAGFFGSQLDDLPGPYERARPHLWHRGYLLSPGAGTPGTQAELANAADSSINVLLDNVAPETGTGADVGSNILLATPAESGAVADAAGNVLLSSAADTGAGADASSNILLATATETASGSDGAGNVLLSGAADAAAGSDGATNVLLATSNEAAGGADAATNILLTDADTATATDGASVVQFSQVAVGFFASQGIVPGEGNEIPGPLYRQRPYWRYDGPLLSADSGGAPTAISAGDAANAADAATNVLLASATDAVVAADAAINVLLANAADAIVGTDAASNVLLASAADAAAAADAAFNILVAAAENANGADFALGILLAGQSENGSGADFGVVLIVAGGIAVGFFASQGIVPREGNEIPGPLYRQRPYWRYRGPLVASAIASPATIQDVSVRTGALQSAWIMTPEGPRWVIIFGTVNSDWSLKVAQAEVNV